MEVCRRPVVVADPVLPQPRVSRPGPHSPPPNAPQGLMDLPPQGKPGPGRPGCSSSNWRVTFGTLWVPLLEVGGRAKFGGPAQHMVQKSTRAVMKSWAGGPGGSGGWCLQAFLMENPKGGGRHAQEPWWSACGRCRTASKPGLVASGDRLARPAGRSGWRQGGHRLGILESRTSSCRQRHDHHRRAGLPSTQLAPNHFAGRRLLRRR
jgi:hypothetical protein